MPAPGCPPGRRTRALSSHNGRPGSHAHTQVAQRALGELGALGRFGGDCSVPPHSPHGDWVCPSAQSPPRNPLKPGVTVTPQHTGPQGNIPEGLPGPQHRVGGGMLPRGGGGRWGRAAPICFALGSGWRRTPRMSLLGECLCTAGGQGGAAHVNLRRVAEPPDPAIFIVRRNSPLGWREPLPSALAEELAARGRGGGTEMLWAGGSPRVLGPGNLVVAVPGTLQAFPPQHGTHPGVQGQGAKNGYPECQDHSPSPPKFGAITGGGRDWQQLLGLCCTVALAGSPPTHPGTQRCPCTGPAPCLQADEPPAG